MDSVTSLISRHTHHIQNISALLRHATALTFWSTAHLPDVARSSANFVVHIIIPVVMDLRFLFLLSNLIILSLLFLARPSPSLALVLPKPHIQIHEEKTNKEPVLKAEPEKEEEAAVSTAEPEKEEEEAVSTVDPEKEKRTKKHVQGGSTLRRTRSLTTTAVVRMRMATELRRAQTSLKIEKARDEREFRDVVEAFIEKQRKFSEDENNLVSH